MRATTIILGGTLLLTACIPLQNLDVEQEQNSSFTPNRIAQPQVPIVLPPESSSSSSGTPTGTGALAERIVEHGILEIGNPEATALTVFTNYSCRYCTEFTRDMLPRLGHEFLRADSLKLQLVITPLKKYPNSGLETSSLICASALGKGQTMHDALTEAKLRDRKSILALAKPLGLPVKEFTACLDAEETSRLLAEQQEFIRMQEVVLIPSFLLNGEKLTGLPSYADLRGWIRAAK